MNPKFLSDEELKTAFETVKKSQIKGERVKSWSSAGTSVTKESNSGGVSDAARGNIFAREIRYRIHEGRIKQEDFPFLPAIPRPQQERIAWE